MMNWWLWLPTSSIVRRVPVLLSASTQGGGVEKPFCPQSYFTLWTCNIIRTITSRISIHGGPKTKERAVHGSLPASRIGRQWGSAQRMVCTLSISCQMGFGEWPASRATSVSSDAGSQVRRFICLKRIMDVNVSALVSTWFLFTHKFSIIELSDPHWGLMNWINTRVTKVRFGSLSH